MFKLIISSITFVLLGTIAYKIFSNSSDDTFIIKEGLWLEMPNSKGNFGFGDSPIILEKIPNKDLIIFGISGDDKPSKLIQINKNEYGEILPLSLLPIFDCIFTSKIELEKLKINLACSDNSLKKITLKNTGSSIITQTKIDNLQDEVTTNSLSLISKIENLNKKIHSIKKLTKNTYKQIDSVEELGEPGDNNEDSEIKRSINTYLTDPNLLKQDLEKNNIQLNNLENERKEIIRLSNIGSEINLASRLNKIEWNILSKKWKKNNKPSNSEITKNEENNSIDVTNLKNSPNETISEKNNANEATELNQNDNSWWKKF
jgi:hypothetical protein